MAQDRTARHNAGDDEFEFGPWPKIFLLLITIGMVAGFIAGFWTGILELCFGAVLIARLPVGNLSDKRVPRNRSPEG